MLCHLADVAGCYQQPKPTENVMTRPNVGSFFGMTLAAPLKRTPSGTPYRLLAGGSTEGTAPGGLTDLMY